jgi:glycosyltransferase involved in cell wall biosynthesis
MGPADILVFIDDDERVEASWLTELFASCIGYEADVVLGPVSGQCHESSATWLTRGSFFEKKVPKTGTMVDWKETRTSNTLVRGKWFYNKPLLRFDKSLGLSGGSDSELFSRMQRRGAKFISCKEALVTEDIPASRANFRWLWKRWYRNGLIYERIAATMPEEPMSLVRFTRRMGATFLMLCRGMPQALQGQPEECVRGLLKLALGLGGLKAWMIPDATTLHVAYPDSAKAKDYQRSVKVAFLTNIISPYRLPVFRKLSETPEWNFKIFTDADMEFDRAWRTEHSGLQVKRTACLSWKRTVASSRPVSFNQVITLHCPFGLMKDLLTFRPNVVISLELGLRTAFAALYCAVTRTPLVIWAYQSRISSSQGSRRLLWRRLLLKRAARVVGMGQQAREVLIKWGVPPERIIDAPNAADHVTLEARLAQTGAADKARILKDHYAGKKKLAIVVGRLIPLKGIEHMLQTWKGMPADLKMEWQLVFIGDGPLASTIEAEADPSITLAGHARPDAMAYWYAAADLHIFPTCGDVWGLVVNEASACGTPSLCSIHAGCFDDLITHGKNGLAIDFTNNGAAGLLLEEALTRPDLHRLGKAAKKHISRFTLDNLAERFRKAAQPLIPA